MFQLLCFVIEVCVNTANIVSEIRIIGFQQRLQIQIATTINAIAQIHYNINFATTIHRYGSIRNFTYQVCSHIANLISMHQPR